MFEHATELKNMLLTHCGDSLTESRLGLCNFRNFEGAKEPWTKNKTLQISKGTLEAKLSHVIRWFPNITCLRLSNVCFSIANLSIARFNHLKMLLICNKKGSIEPITQSAAGNIGTPM